MLTVHHVNAVLVIAVCATAGVAALVARRRGAGGWVAHLLALAQTLLVAQVGLGLLLLADHKRAGERLHYAYGAFALLAVAALSRELDKVSAHVPSWTARRTSVIPAARSWRGART